MSWYKIATSKINKEKTTKEMIDWHNDRLNKHIERVGKYCRKIAKYDDRFSDLLERLKTHDQSKLKEPEYTPYIFITWKYKCKADGKPFEISEEMEEKMQKATEYHVTHNRHHPEFHSKRKTNLINKNDRDKPPTEIVDATGMDDVDIAEMIADWCAVSEEKNNSPREWADKNVNTRWKFTDEQKDLIYELIDNVWEK